MAASYWQLVRRSAPLSTLLELGTVAEHHGTEMAHALLRAIITAKYEGSRYGWGRG